MFGTAAVEGMVPGLPGPDLLVTCHPVEDDRARALVTVCGPLVLRSGPRLRLTLMHALDSGISGLDIDLIGVTDADPAGLASLVVAARRVTARANEDCFRFVGMSAECRDVMQRLHLFTEHRRRLSFDS